jgi:hypothetical protein
MDLDINNYLKLNFYQLSSIDICNDNDFSTYENFKKFILDHYYLKHIEKKNYIKYVKVKRQIIMIKEGKKYNNYINNINSIIRIMFENNIFSNIDIRRYMYKINFFFKLLNDKKNTFITSIYTIRSLFDLKGDNYAFKVRIMYVINNLIRKYHIFLKNSKKIIFLVNQLLELESSYEIDHNLITLNNDINLTSTSKLYGVYNGTYIFYTKYPITFLNKGKENLFFVSGLNGMPGIGPDGITNYIFYSGVIQVKIFGNFRSFYASRMN